jgi:steroid delta-isomerase
MSTGYDLASVISRFYASIRANNVEEWVALFAPDATVADPVGTPVHRGRDQARAFLKGILEQFEIFGIVENDVYYVPKGAAAKWTGIGRGKNGRDVTFEGIDVFEVNDNGLIKALSAYWNAGPVLEAITVQS